MNPSIPKNIKDELANLQKQFKQLSVEQRTEILKSLFSSSPPTQQTLLFDYSDYKDYPDYNDYRDQYGGPEKW